MEKIILLDTSFLMACAEFKIDYFSEFARIFAFAYKPVIFDDVISELKRLELEGDFKKKRVAKLALAIINKKNVTIIQTENKGLVDDLFMNFANKNRIVATIDGVLKKQLKNHNIPVIIVRQKKYLALIEC